METEDAIKKSNEARSSLASGASEVLTGSQRDLDLIESCRLGVNRYVMKPVNAAKFMQAVGDIGNYWLNLNHPPAH